MPIAKPEISVTVNLERLADLEVELGLKSPITLQVRPLSLNDKRPGAGELRGDCQGHTIRVMYGLSEQSFNRLLFVQTQIVRTTLHEARHVWQNESWSPAKWVEDATYSYAIRPSEVDARDFADKNVKKYRNLVRVKRQYARSTLGRLAQAEQTIRQERR